MRSIGRRPAQKREYHEDVDEAKWFFKKVQSPIIGMDKAKNGWIECRQERKGVLRNKNRLERNTVISGAILSWGKKNKKG